MTQLFQVRAAAACGGLAVGLGAFGAHGLEGVLEANGTVDVWETAVLYHFVHTLVLLWLAGRERLTGIWWSFLGGIVVFSGTLYLLALTGVKWLGAITPIGGVAFLVGWFWLAWRAGSSANR